MPVHIDPRIHPDIYKQDRDTGFRDPFGYQLDRYEQSPADDLEDFVAYCFALSHDCVSSEDDVFADRVGDVHLVREQLIVLLISYLADYFAGKVGLGAAYSRATVDIGTTWRVVDLTAEVVTFALEAPSSAVAERRVLLSRKVLDGLQDRWADVKPVFEHYFYLNKVVTLVYRLRMLSAWCGEQDLRAVESILHETWQAAADRYGDVHLLAQQVALFSQVQASARVNALSRALAPRH